jgi:hypothetical protein
MTSGITVREGAQVEAETRVSEEDTRMEKKCFMI